MMFGDMIPAVAGNTGLADALPPPVIALGGVPGETRERNALLPRAAVRGGAAAALQPKALGALMTVQAVNASRAQASLSAQILRVQVTN